MNFNKHSAIEGQHAFLSPSKYHWMNYNEEQLTLAYKKHLATLHGTRLHAFASECISLGISLPKVKTTLNLYVNDAIKYKLTTEQPLYFSENCFGTADAIGFDGKTLRIHDLKTGMTKASIHQLEVYAAIFCLEYEIDPNDISIELRLYQSDHVLTNRPKTDNILKIMQTIVIFDKLIINLKEGDS